MEIVFLLVVLTLWVVVGLLIFFFLINRRGARGEKRPMLSREWLQSVADRAAVEDEPESDVVAAVIARSASTSEPAPSVETSSHVFDVPDTHHDTSSHSFDSAPTDTPSHSHDFGGGHSGGSGHSGDW